jgi:hypothetical protein
MSDLRTCIQMVILAKPKSGKSYLLSKVIIPSIVKRKGRVLVVDPDGGEMLWYNSDFKRYNDITQVPNNFKGVAVVMYSGKEAHGTPTFPYIQNKLEGRKFGERGPWAKTTIILDDSNRYADGKVEDALEFLVQRKRQFGCDLIVTAHNWQQLAPIFYGFIDLYLIGPTATGPETRSAIIKGQAMKNLQAVRAKVNAEKAKDPEKSFPWATVTADGLPFTGQI